MKKRSRCAHTVGTRNFEESIRFDRDCLSKDFVYAHRVPLEGSEDRDCWKTPPFLECQFDPTVLHFLIRAESLFFFTVSLLILTASSGTSFSSYRFFSQLFWFHHVSSLLTVLFQSDTSFLLHLRCLKLKRVSSFLFHLQSSHGASRSLTMMPAKSPSPSPSRSPWKCASALSPSPNESRNPQGSIRI